MTASLLKKRWKRKFVLLRLNMAETETKEHPTQEVKKPSLKANFVFNFISQALSLLVPIITTPYLSRVLHETGNGQYSYAVSIVTIFVLFANLGFSGYGQREMAKRQDDRVSKSKCFWEIIILRCCSTLIVSAVFYSMLFTIGFQKCN